MKIVRPCCTAVTRRVVNDRPSRSRSTWYTIGTPGRPGRRKYACSECTGRSPSVVRPAATSAWPATWPPKTRCSDSSGLRPRKMLTSICSRSSRSTRLSAGFVMGGFLLCSQLADIGDTDDRTALRVGGGEVDLRTDAPVVVVVRVVEDLPHAPQPVLRLFSMISSLGPRASGPVPSSSYSSQYLSMASPHASASQPASASISPSSPTWSRAASSTRRNMALRTSTRKARALAVTGRTWSAFS
ncbi:hypothetical protein STENM327S_08997 [Streptomyces tendae]